MSDTEERLSKLEKALMGMESTQTGLLDAMTKLTESLNKPHVSEVSRSQDQTGAHDVDAEDAERESHAGDQRHPDAPPDDEGDGGVDDGAREAGGATERAAAAAAAAGGGVGGAGGARRAWAAPTMTLLIRQKPHEHEPGMRPL